MDKPGDGPDGPEIRDLCRTIPGTGRTITPGQELTTDEVGAIEEDLKMLGDAAKDKERPG